MEPESLAESGRKCNVAILKCHDDKRFRVRSLSDFREVYQRYFNYKAATRVSKIQIVLAIVVAACQVVTMCILRFTTSLEVLGMGHWTSILTLFAAASVLWTCKRTSYLRLHLSMALHIVATLASVFFLLLAFEEAIPQLRRRLYSNYLTPSQPGNDARAYNSLYQLDLEFPTTPRTMKYYSREHGPMSITALCLTLTAMMAVVTMVQMALSLMMAVMTGRAMCIGRIKMEEKLFAMEIAGKEEKDTVMVIPCQPAAPPRSPEEPKPASVSTLIPTPPPSYNKVLLGHSDTDSVA